MYKRQPRVAYSGGGVGITFFGLVVKYAVVVVRGSRRRSMLMNKGGFIINKSTITCDFYLP